MRFSELDTRMRRYERTGDTLVPPGNYIIARMDGRGFTTKTRDEWHCEAPFDPAFHMAMNVTMRDLVVNSGFKMAYGYTQSDEISVLLDPIDATFNHKERKLFSVLAGEASASFTAAFGKRAAFDVHLSVLPMHDLVIDYFRWRQEDAYRNSLNAYAYWIQRSSGVGAKGATETLRGLSNGAKIEFLETRGVPWHTVPEWHKYGSAVYQNAAGGYELSDQLPNGRDYHEFLTQLFKYLVQAP